MFGYTVDYLKDSLILAFISAFLIAATTPLYYTNLSDSLLCLEQTVVKVLSMALFWNRIWLLFLSPASLPSSKLCG